jgi:hypothetical protein
MTGAGGQGKRSALALVRAAVAAPLAAGLAVAAFTVLLYRDGLWSVPRWDHLVYLYEASQFATNGELLAHAPAWNRAVSVGDHAEFRPLFHLMLGVEQVLFGRAYMAWQAVGIGLHALLAALLVGLGRRAFRGLAAPVCLAALFGSALLAAETVVWFHANAYVLCALLLVASLERLLAFLETGRRGPAGAAALLALVAAFTYELGAIYCVVVGAVLAMSALGGARRGAVAGDASAPRGARLVAGGVHLLAVAVYAAVSLADLHARFGGIGGSDVRPPGLGDLGPGLGFAGRQVGFWLGGLLVPGLYDIAPGSRATFIAFNRPAGPAAALAVAPAVLCLVGAAGLLRGRLAASAPGLLAGAAFLGVYSLVVALGRSVPRGLAYTLEQNLQHAYPALLAAVATVILGAWSWRRSGSGAAGPDLGVRDPSARPGGRWASGGLVALGAIGLIWANAAATTAFLSEFRHSYDAPRLELIHHVARWHARPGRAAYFRIADDCPGHDPLPWFGPYVRHDIQLIYFIDVIFPATSFNLERARLPADTRVDEVSCARGTVAPESLVGPWWERDRQAKIVPVGPLSLDADRVEAVSPGGSRSRLILRERVVVAEAWRRQGTVSHDGRYVFWKGAIPWHR